MDGTPTGRIKCSLQNWIGLVFSIPRDAALKGTDRADLQHSGVYVLFGNDSDTGEAVAYVGLANARSNGMGVLGRIKEHIRDEKKGYFTHAIVITTSNNSLGATEISYLENAFCKKAREAGRVTVDNGDTPLRGSVSEEKEAELQEFISYAEIAIGALGYRIFEPLDARKTGSTSPAQAILRDETDDSSLFLNARGASGEGLKNADGFVVLAGSTLRPELTASCPESVSQARDRYASQIGDSNETLRDLQFPSPTAAAQFLVGASINGRTSWTTEAGVTLKQLEEQNLES